MPKLVSRDGGVFQFVIPVGKQVEIIQVDEAGLIVGEADKVIEQSIIFVILW